MYELSASHKNFLERIGSQRIQTGDNRIISLNGYLKQIINTYISLNAASKERVLDIGCGDGETLRAISPQFGMGVDIVLNSISSSPNLKLVPGAVEVVDFSNTEKFDTIVMSGVLENVYDIGLICKIARNVCSDSGRIVTVTYSRLWQPVLRLAELLRLRDKPSHVNWIPPEEISNLMAQNGFELVKQARCVLIPVYIPLISNLINRWIAPLPVFRSLCLARVNVYKPILKSINQKYGLSIVVAARNEAGNIAHIIQRMPKLAPQQEVIFVEGNSSDNTWEVIQNECNIRNGIERDFSLTYLKQPGVGKGDAVRAGFGVAKHEVLMILDADLSVEPEELHQFYELLNTGYCDFANGSRLVYPMDKKAMRFLNLLGNKFFGILFTYLLEQQIRDTLCGTKVLTASSWRHIQENRKYFGDFDPFGDFDMLFGASRLNLKIVDVPVHYKERVYGSTNISRFSHGMLLLKMSWVAARKLKFPSLQNQELG